MLYNIVDGCCLLILPGISIINYKCPSDFVSNHLIPSLESIMIIPEEALEISDRYTFAKMDRRKGPSRERRKIGTAWQCAKINGMFTTALVTLMQ